MSEYPSQALFEAGGIVGFLEEEFPELGCNGLVGIL